MPSRMNVPFLNLAAQYASLKSEILPAVEQVLTSGHYVLGPNVAALEEKIIIFTSNSSITWSIARLFAMLLR